MAALEKYFRFTPTCLLMGGYVNFTRDVSFIVRIQWRTGPRERKWAIPQGSVTSAKTEIRDLGHPKGHFAFNNGIIIGSFLSLINSP